MIIWKWKSDGKGGFDIEKDPVHQIGTKVILKLKSDAKDYLENIRLSTIIKKYSDHINYPVYLFNEDVKDSKEEKVNQSQPYGLETKMILSRKNTKAFIINLA